MRAVIRNSSFVVSDICKIESVQALIWMRDFSSLASLFRESRQADAREKQVLTMLHHYTIWCAASKLDFLGCWFCIPVRQAQSSQFSALRQGLSNHSTVYLTCIDVSPWKTSKLLPVMLLYYNRRRSYRESRSRISLRSFASLFRILCWPPRKKLLSDGAAEIVLCKIID